MYAFLARTNTRTTRLFRRYADSLMMNTRASRWHRAQRSGPVTGSDAGESCELKDQKIRGLISRCCPRRERVFERFAEIHHRSYGLTSVAPWPHPGFIFHGTFHFGILTVGQSRDALVTTGWLRSTSRSRQESTRRIAPRREKAAEKRQKNKRTFYFQRASRLLSRRERRSRRKIFAYLTWKIK